MPPVVVTGVSVTREVSQLEMSALKFCKPEKSPLMSVMRPAGDGAVRRDGGSLVGVVRLDRILQVGLGRKR